MIDLRLGDCLDVMGSIPDGSIDLILADLPYGTTACKWDTVIPFGPLWAHYRRLLGPRGAVVLTASQPFTTDVINSNREWFKYEWIWEKSRPSDKFNVKNKPMKKHENIVVFSSGTTANRSPRRMAYNPQGIVAGGRRVPGLTSERHHQRRPSHRCGNYIAEFQGYPTSILRFASDHRPVHPTQKPVALMEYLIRTYTHEGDTVLDNAMGSGTTIRACLNTGRDGIGIEKDPTYYAIAERRIHAAPAEVA